eukprot:2413329-Pleurochrysis_carterae.AAC.1
MGVRRSLVRASGAARMLRRALQFAAAWCGVSCWPSLPLPPARARRGAASCARRGRRRRRCARACLRASRSRGRRPRCHAAAASRPRRTKSRRTRAATSQSAADHDRGQTTPACRRSQVAQ